MISQVRCNHYPVPPLTRQQDTEPFDEVLDRRIWALSKERITWEEAVAARRLTVPSQVEELVSGLLRSQQILESSPMDTAELSGDDDDNGH